MSYRVLISHYRRARERHKDKHFTCNVQPKQPAHLPALRQKKQTAKGRSGAAANRYVNQNNHCGKEGTKRTRQRKRLQKASKKSPICVNKSHNLFSRHTTNDQARANHIIDTRATR